MQPRVPQQNVSLLDKMNKFAAIFHSQVDLEEFIYCRKLWKVDKNVTKRFEEIN